MSAISELIPCSVPKAASVQILRDDTVGQLVLVIRVGPVRDSIALDAEGWRALHAAIGKPPAPEFVPAARHCRVCYRTQPEGWSAANLCNRCLSAPLERGGWAKGGAR